MNSTIIVAAGGLVRNDTDDLLMIYRRGKWDLPKGKLDEGETIEACAVREVKEETGLKEITLGKLIGITHHRYFDKWIMNDVIKETHWFEMKVKDNPVFIPQKEEDILEIRWVNKKDLPEYLQETYPNIVEIVQKAINQ
ncbi:MAG: NUDIX hydrolase [Ilyomonas sp.]